MRFTFILFLLLAGLPLTTVFAASPSVLRITSELPDDQYLILKGAQRVKALTLTLQARCGGPISIESIVVEHKGMGKFRDIERIYLTEGESRISSVSSWTGDFSSAVLRLSPLTLTPCSTKTVHVVFDMSVDAATGGEHSIHLVPEELASNATRVLYRSIRTPTTLKTAAIRMGNVDLSFLPLPHNLYVGMKRKLSRFSMEASSEYDQMLYSITLHNDGSAKDTDLRNIHLVTSFGSRITNYSSMQGKYSTLIFNPPYLLPRSHKQNFYLLGDLYTRKGGTVNIQLKEASDLYAVPILRRARN